MAIWKSGLPPGLALLMFAAALCGCRSARERALERREPRNLLFQKGKTLPELGLSAGEKGSMLLFECSENQSLHILQVAKGARLEPRYHARQDLTLLCIAGGAIVEVEGTRHVLTPSSALLIPRFYTYSILPHGSDEDFAAIAVFSPPYDAEDVVLVEGD